MTAKLDYSYVKGKFEEEGYTLLSGEYVSSRVPLEFVCSKGHKTTISWDSFRAGRRCKVCANNCVLSINCVRKSFEDRGFTLLSDKYKNNRTKLFFECSEGHTDTIDWMSFRQGGGCSFCAGNVKYGTQYIYSRLKEEGYFLLSNYRRAHSKIEIKCPVGHIYKAKWNDFSNGRRCPDCFGTPKYTIEEVSQVFQAEGYSLLSEQYDGNRVPVWYKCPKGHTHKIRYDCFKNSGHRCPTCVSGSPVSRISQEWLDEVGIPQEYREFSIKIDGKLYKVDGFDPATGTVYEFLGKYYHGDPRFFAREEMNPTVGKTFGELHDQTFQRFAELNTKYTVIYVWENDYKSGRYKEGLIWQQRVGGLDSQ